jgi:alpha-mannosidase
MRRRVSIVPHTHWDREWYEPFPTFRFRLVQLLDDLFPRLESDRSYAHFLLDGQMAVVDDYLAVRPSAEPALRRLAASGRLAMGPWYTLPDEFLVSGETLVRNLQLGFARAAAFGGAMAVGYLPDMFGHVAQMPQLLRLFGLEHAVVWRGVPAAIDRTAFWWEAPDGSTVRAEYLPTGYGNGASAPEEAKVLLDRIRGWEAEHARLLGDGPVLWMNGSDHQAPQAHLGRVVHEANLQADGAYELVVTSLAEHLRTAPVGGLPRWQGELRSGARANLLMGVASNRVDVKQAAARAERALERLAEPMFALFAPAELWPQALLDEAWLDVLRNAAHDSVCACSVDEVCDAVLQRYRDASRIGEDLADYALRLVGAQVAATGPLVVNPTARARGGLVEVVVRGEVAPDGTQVVAVEPARRPVLDLPAPSAVAVLGEIVGWSSGLSGVTYEVTGDGLEVVLRADGTTGEPAERSAVLARLALLATRPDLPVRAWLQGVPSVRVLARTEGVPAFGWAPALPAASVAPVTVSGTTMANGLVVVAVDPATGTFSLDGLPNFGRLADGGDAGDTYNYSPPATDCLVDTPEHVSVTVLETGPLRARARVDATYRWPGRVDDLASARSGEREVRVTTTLEVRAGERAVRVEVELDNQCEDHRLRAHLPLPRPASTSHAECAFAVVERRLTAEGGPTEVGLPTFPSRRFVQAGGLTVVHDGLLEYELVDVRDGRAHELALTLLRATRFLSRGPMAYRPLPAGPVVEMAGSQVRGRHVLRYAVQVGDADPYAVADDVLVPLRVAYAAGLGSLPDRQGALEVLGAEVSSVRRRDGGLEVRVHNPRDAETTVTVPGRTGWVVDLRGRTLAPFDGTMVLRPWGIATLALTG